jgi:hypothetical protein
MCGVLAAKENEMRKPSAADAALAARVAETVGRELMAALPALAEGLTRGRKVSFTPTVTFRSRKGGGHEVVLETRVSIPHEATVYAVGLIEDENQLALFAPAPEVDEDDDVNGFDVHAIED